MGGNSERAFACNAGQSMRARRRGILGNARAATLAATLSVLLGAAAHAHTTIAAVPDMLPNTISAAWAYGTQAEADVAALAACQNNANQQGLAREGLRCAVLERQPVPGFGTIVCGSNGCASGYGDTAALALQAAMISCTSPEGPRIPDCDPTRSLQWQDDAFPSASIPPSAPPQPQADRPAPLPAGMDATTTARVNAFLQQAYGAFDPGLQCWTSQETSPAGTQRYCWQVARMDVAPARGTANAADSYLLVVADAIDDAGNVIEFNANSGMVGAFALRWNGTALVPRASLHGLPLGQGGRAPREWLFVQVAPTEFGYLAEASGFTQGMFASRNVLLVAHGNAMTDIGFRSGFNNEAACADPACADSAVDIGVHFEFDVGEPATPLYPLRLTISEKRGGVAQQPRRHLSRFDERTWRYVMPADAALQELEDMN